MNSSYDFVVPSAKEYTNALKKLKKTISDEQRQMLESHFRSANQSAPFTKLAGAVATDDYPVAIGEYENLGRMVGDTLDMAYLESVAKPGEPFYCSALGSGNPYRSEDENYQLVMHRELVEALRTLKWFK